MQRLIITPVFCLLSLIFSVGLALPATALQTTQSAKAVCQDNQAAVDWTFSNKESASSVNVSVKDEQSGKSVVARVVAAGQAISGTLSTGKTDIAQGKITFSVTMANDEKSPQSLTASYLAIKCSPAAQTPTAAETGLPNTGPLDVFGPFIALLLASGSAWLITRNELIRNAKRNRS